MNDALFDIRAGRGGLWQARADQVSALIDQSGRLWTPSVRLPRSTSALPATSQASPPWPRDFATTSGPADRSRPPVTAGPRIGMLTPKPVDGR